MPDKVDAAGKLVSSLELKVLGALYVFLGMVQRSFK
jgi:hypothetical protein